MSRADSGRSERAQREILALRFSLYHACRDFPGGAAAIAAIYGRNPTTLQHKMSPTQPSHSPNPDEIEEVIAATRDPRIVDSILEAYGDAAWVDLRELLQSFDHDKALPGVLKAVGETLQRQSALTDSVARHLADDGRIDREELSECKLHLRRIQGALLALERMLERAVEGRDG
ncbi:phage regulatory CII family protein [Azotobacter vinelandii]